MIGVQYAACGVLDARILLTSTAMGLLVTNILYSHSVLDRQADARMDKTTLALLLDKRGPSFSPRRCSTSCLLS